MIRKDALLTLLEMNAMPVPRIDIKRESSSLHTRFARKQKRNTGPIPSLTGGIILPVVF